MIITLTLAPPPKSHVCQKFKSWESLNFATDGGSTELWLHISQVFNVGYRGGQVGVPRSQGSQQACIVCEQLMAFLNWVNCGTETFCLYLFCKIKFIPKILWNKCTLNLCHWPMKSNTDKNANRISQLESLESLIQWCEPNGCHVLSTDFAGQVTLEL